MSEISDYGDVLPAEMIDVWPILAQAVRRLDGSLMGGTALALHLRHRPSFDLDYMTSGTFSGINLARKIARIAPDMPVETISAGTDTLDARVGGVAVQVFLPPSRPEVGHLTVLQAPTSVTGMKVGSLPDLLAAKMDVILRRPKLRDYIDIKAIDEMSPYSLEDGILFHMRRYGSTTASRDLSRIVDLLEDPGPLQADRVFGSGDDALEYLKHRAQELRQYLYHEVIGRPSNSDPDPQGRPKPALGRDTADGIE